jgi:hypothetical protein
LPNFPLAGAGTLPPIKADKANDFIDIVDDALDQLGGLLVADFLEQFRKGGFAATLVVGGSCAASGR